MEYIITIPPKLKKIAWQLLIRNSIKISQGTISYRICIWITMTSHWARWRLKSPASRLFAQPFIQAQINKKHQSSASLAFVWGIHRWPVNSPHKKRASNAENISIWWRHHVKCRLIWLPDTGVLGLKCQHVEAWTQWPTLWRQEMHFPEWKLF